MKKKPVIFLITLLILSIITANTVYAKSTVKKITATFNSYIVKKDSKSTNVKTIYYGNVVYIPIQTLGFLTGSPVKKKGKEFNVTSTHSRFENIRLLTKVSNTYKNLGDQYYLLNEHAEKLGTQIQQVITDSEVNIQISNIKNNYDNYYYNKHQDILLSITDIEKLAGKSTNSYLKDSKRREIIKENYILSVESLKLSIQSLSQYTKTKDKNYLLEANRNLTEYQNSIKKVKDSSDQVYNSLYTQIITN